MSKFLLAAMVAAMPLPAFAQPVTTVASPDGTNSVSVAIDDENRLRYTVSRRGEPILAPSPISLELDADQIGYGMAITGTRMRDGVDSYPIVAGRAAMANDAYHEMSVDMAESGGAHRRMTVIFRAYDNGVAFHTSLPVQPQTVAAVVRSESTGFYFPRDYRCWGFNIGRFGKSHEGEFDPVDTGRTREHNLFDAPFLCETGKAAFAITESDVNGSAAMYLSGRGDSGKGVQVVLSPSPDDPRVAIRSRIGTPIETPWRVVMLADHAGQLIESTLVTSLAEPSKIADTSWIKPGKSSWDWWNGISLRSVEQPGTNTASAKAYVDFAAANGFQYALIDDGWYVGSGQAPKILPGTDLTRWTPEFDLPEVVRYAKDKGVKIWLWAHWIAMDRQMEESLALFERLGVAGVKVDFMDRDDQVIVDWYEKLFATAARHHLMVDLHGAFVPRGLNRTWPNFVTQEGVMGAEYNKWSARITARHNVMLAYTRAMLGPADYTPGGFRNVAPADFKPRNTLPFVQTTRAHGLAMYVVYESPFACVSDSPDTYADLPGGLDFIRAVPTAWDETRFLAGDVGDYVVVARRKGTHWYIGAMNADTARTVTLSLDFLGKGSFSATLWSDGAKPTDAVKTSRAVTKGDMLTLDLAATGGAAVEIAPR